MKKLLAVILTVFLASACVPGASFAATSQMRDGVPEWTETTVKQYAMDFINGNDLETLYSYYDLQIRRYMPFLTFSGMMTEIEWMTGGFITFGTYETYEETDQETRTHVLHLCMEKQDLDLYFTHKNKENDWEVMAVEFVPSAKQEADTSAEAVAAAGADDSDLSDYTEINVQVGEEPYLLNGIITLPYNASLLHKVPGVVLVQGEGELDMDNTIGQTKLFADIADLFAKRGIATIRFDKRTYTYGDTLTQEDWDNLTVEEETIQDAISAGKLLAANSAIDTARLVVLGHGLGASITPRIASESDGLFTAMILLAGSPLDTLQLQITQQETALETLEGDALVTAQADVDELETQYKALKKIRKAEKAREVTVNGRNGYYYLEMMQVDECQLIRKLKLPTFILQGNMDFEVSLEDGIQEYKDDIKTVSNLFEYQMFRNLNHLMMIYEGPADAKGTMAEYDTPEKLDTQAGHYMADWILGQYIVDDEE